MSSLEAGMLLSKDHWHAKAAQYVLKTGGAGMAYWELSQDATDQFSLIDSVYREVLGFEGIALE